MFSAVLALAALVLVAQHPLDGQWWLTLVIFLAGMALYYPFPASVRMHKTMTIDCPLPEVYDFLSRPANLHLWNPRVGASQPADVPVELGQEWTYSLTRRWLRTTPLRHVFSKLDPPHLIEVTATGHGLRAINAYSLSNVGKETVLTFDATMSGMPAPVAWLASAVGRFFPNADLARLKRALEPGAGRSQ